MIRVEIYDVSPRLLVPGIDFPYRHSPMKKKENEKNTNSLGF